MRLLKTEGSSSPQWLPQLIDFRGEDYSILSHRWEANANDEVLFADIRIIDDGGILDERQGLRHSKFYHNPAYSHRDVARLPGFNKLQGAAQLAAREGHSFIWVDTCCIDKSSSAELSEAINSMFKWYNQSKVCFAYLKDVPDSLTAVETHPMSAFARSEWWSRAWCLQELVAPLDVVFFTCGWQLIGEKKALASTIVAITSIGMDVLTHARILDQVSIAKRMSWASSRKASRIEDIAYSLMGIFSINMPLLYGEGEKAFLRLQEEILKGSDDESLFGWVDPDARDEDLRGLLATSPAYFAKSSEVVYYQDFEDRVPSVMTNRGLSITMRLSRYQDGRIAAALQCPVAHTGDGFLAIYLQQVSYDRQQFARVKCSKLAALQGRGAPQSIFVRQKHETHQLDRILPFHFFSLRKLLLGEADERYELVKSTFKPYDNPAPQTSFPRATSYAGPWRRNNSSVFQVHRGEGKFTAALLFGGTSNPNASDSQVTLTNENPDPGSLVVMLGSTSMTEVSFDAHQIGSLPTVNELEAMFRPHVGGTFKELEDFHVKVDFEAHVHSNTQLFLTDITISKIARANPFHHVTEAFSHHVEPFVPLLRERREAGHNQAPDLQPEASSRPWMKKLLKGR